MDALISGRAGLALVVDRGKLASIHAVEPERTIPRQPHELHFLTGEARDFSTVENASRGEIVRELVHARQREEGLQLALILLDPDLPEDIRAQAASELEEMLDEALAVGLENVLYGKPLPAAADLEVGLTIARGTGTRQTESLLERLHSHQQAIREVRAAWETVPAQLFGGQEQVWQSVAVRQGAFRELVLNRAAQKRANDFFVTVAMNPEFRSLPNHRAILQAWIDPFLKRAEVHREPRAPLDMQPSEVRQHKVKYRMERRGRKSEDLVPATTTVLAIDLPGKIGEHLRQALRGRPGLTIRDLVLEALEEWLEQHAEKSPERGQRSERRVLDAPKKL